MPIQIDSTANFTGTTANPSVSHTGGSGENRLLVVCITFRNGTAPTAPTYGGQALTLAPTGTMVNGTVLNSAIYYLVNPPTGINTLSFTHAAIAWWIQAHNLSGANQTTPVRDSQKSFSNTGTPNPTTTTALTTVAGDLAIDIIGTRTTTNTGLTASGSQHLDASSTISNLIGGSSDLAASGTSTSMAWTLTVNDNYAHVAAAFAPAPAKRLNGITTRQGRRRSLVARAIVQHRERPVLLRARSTPTPTPLIVKHVVLSKNPRRQRSVARVFVQNREQARIVRARSTPTYNPPPKRPVSSTTSTSRVVGRRVHHQARITRAPVARPAAVAPRAPVAPVSGSSRTLRSHRHHQARISSSVRGAPAPFFRPKVVVHGGGRRSSVARGYVGHHELPRITRAPMPPPAFVRNRPVIVRNARRSATSSALAHGRGAALLRRPPRLAPTPPYFRPKILVLARGPDVSHRYVRTSSSRFMRSSVIGAPAAVHAPRHSLTRAQIRYLGRRRRTTP